MVRDLPNIGIQLATELARSGVTTPIQLVELGSLAVATRLQENGFSVCHSKLCALEGAIRGVRWHSIPTQERLALWRAYQELENNSSD
jgi:TfoX C-terminal domain